MPDTILPYEPYVRLGVSVGVFVLLAAWELIGPDGASRPAALRAGPATSASWYSIRSLSASSSP